MLLIQNIYLQAHTIIVVSNTDNLCVMKLVCYAVQFNV